VSRACEEGHSISSASRETSKLDAAGWAVATHRFAFAEQTGEIDKRCSRVRAGGRPSVDDLLLYEL
jgi:hypothetical protein